MSPDTILYLSGNDVAAALDHVDVVGAVADALAAHGRGETILPPEASAGSTTARRCAASPCRERSTPFQA